MRVALVRPPHGGSLVRGVGFYAQRLFDSLVTLGLDIHWVDFSFSPIRYSGYDLVHFPYFDLFYLTFPPVRFSKTVVTLHDVTPLVFPEAFPVGIRGKNVWPIQKALLQTADAILTDSENSKRDIIKITGAPAGKVAVTYLAPDDAFRPMKNPEKKYGLPKDFVLYVGGVNWNKNLPTLVRACKKAELPLVIVGKEALGEGLDLFHAESRPFKELLGLIDDGAKVIRLGFVQTSDLVAVYNLAKVYCQPSVYEGFGLPILEAMSCGTPVVCGKNSSLTEIAGEAGHYANVEDEHDLAAKLLSAKPGKELAQAAKFTWGKTAKATYEIYEKVLGKQ